MPLTVPPVVKTKYFGIGWGERTGGMGAEKDTERGSNG